jgi:hypothetical protein
VRCQLGVQHATLNRPEPAREREIPARRRQCAARKVRCLPTQGRRGEPKGVLQLSESFPHLVGLTSNCTACLCCREMTKVQPHAR